MQGDVAIHEVARRMLSSFDELSRLQCPECGARAFCYQLYGRDLRIRCGGAVNDRDNLDRECSYIVIVHAADVENLPKIAWKTPQKPQPSNLFDHRAP